MTDSSTTSRDQGQTAPPPILRPSRVAGVHIRVLQVIPDERGRLMEILRRDDPYYAGFGQLYMTTAWPGVVKAWHRHQRQTDHFCCVKGMIKLVLYDGREDSPTFGQVQECCMGDQQMLMVQIPAGVFHGFKNIGTEEALVINCVTEPYNAQDPDEERFPAHDGPVPYVWARQDR